MCFLLLGGFVKPALRAARYCSLSLHFHFHVPAGLEIPAVGLRAGSGMETPSRAFQSQMLAVLRGEAACKVISPKAGRQELPVQMNL